MPLNLSAVKKLSFLLVFFLPLFSHAETAKEAVAERFGENSVMYHVAFCESGFRNIQSDFVNKNGEREESFGVFQIHRPSWGKKAESMGLDILNTKDNIVFAQWLYVQQGTKPWNSSKSCWLARSAKVEKSWQV